MRKFIFGILFMAGFVSSSAWACECPKEAFKKKASKANIERAALIAEGVILRVIPPEPNEDAEAEQSAAAVLGGGADDGADDGAVQKKVFDPYSKAVLGVTQSYKGQVEPGGEVSVYFDTTSSCGFQIEAGKSGMFMFYAQEDRLVAPGLCESYISKRDRKDLKRGKYLDPGR